jgi:hypothetical protein
MIGVFVHFAYTDGFDKARVLKVAETAHPSFVGMPGLRYKFFTLDESRNRATNFYVWDSEDPARKFFTDALTERVTGLYGVAPTIEFVEIAAAVENVGAAAASGAAQ